MRRHPVDLASSASMPASARRPESARLDNPPLTNAYCRQSLIGTIFHQLTARGRPAQRPPAAPPPLRREGSERLKNKTDDRRKWVMVSGGAKGPLDLHRPRTKRAAAAAAGGPGGATPRRLHGSPSLRSPAAVRVGEGGRVPEGSRRRPGGCGHLPSTWCLPAVPRHRPGVTVPPRLGHGTAALDPTQTPPRPPPPRRDADHCDAHWAGRAPRSPPVRRIRLQPPVKSHLAYCASERRVRTGGNRWTCVLSRRAGRRSPGLRSVTPGRRPEGGTPVEVPRQR